MLKGHERPGRAKANNTVKMGYRTGAEPLPSESKGHSSEIVSARQFLFVMWDDVPSAQLDRSCDILIRAGLSRARDLRARGASWPDFDQKPRGSAWIDAIDRKNPHSTLSRSGMPR